LRDWGVTVAEQFSEIPAPFVVDRLRILDELEEHLAHIVAVDAELLCDQFIEFRLGQLPGGCHGRFPFPRNSQV
jgi:hypothetical protein